MTPHPTGDPLGLLDPSLDVPADEALGQVAGPDGRRSRRWRGLLVWSATSAPVASPPHGRNRVRPSGHQPAVSGDAALARSGGARCARGAGRARRVGRGRPSSGRPARVRGRVSRCRSDHARRLGRDSRWSRSPRCHRSPGRFWILILAGGICAATSLTLPAGNPLEPRTAATRVIELGVLLPIVAGGLVLAWLRAGSSGRSRAPRGASVRRHPGSGRRRMAAVDAGLFRNGGTRICRVGTAPRRRRRGRPFAVRAVRRTGRWRVLAVCGTTPARDDQSGRALRAAPPAGARAAGGRGSCGSLGGVARTWGRATSRCVSSGSWPAAPWRGVSPA